MTPATGISCALCGGTALLIEALTIGGVSGVTCERCTDCGAVRVIPRRGPSAEDQEAAERTGQQGTPTYTGRCEDCALPIGGRGTRCGDCTMQRVREKAARERAAAHRQQTGNLTFGEVPPCLVRCERCDATLVWAYRYHKRPRKCSRCRREDDRTRREARRVRESMEHVGTIVPRVMHDLECGRPAAAGDVRCRECRSELDSIYGEEAVS